MQCAYLCNLLPRKAIHTRQWLVCGTSRACQAASICGTLPDSMPCETTRTASLALLLAPAVLTKVLGLLCQPTWHAVLGHPKDTYQWMLPRKHIQIFVKCRAWSPWIRHAWLVVLSFTCLQAAWGCLTGVALHNRPCKGRDDGICGMT